MQEMNNIPKLFELASAAMKTPMLPIRGLRSALPFSAATAVFTPDATSKTYHIPAAAVPKPAPLPP